MELDRFLEQKLSSLQKASRTRSLIENKTIDARSREVNGKTILQFSSNDYLGLANDERILEAAYKAGKELGVGSSGSRLITGSYPLLSKFEEQLSELKGTEAALYFSSGYTANIAAIATIMGPGDVIFSDSHNHSSILSGIKLSGAKLLEYPHLDLKDLESKLTERSQFKNALIVTESIFSMDGDIAPIEELYKLSQKYGCWLMIDEAHSFGVCGKQGQGLVSELGLNKKIEIQMGTFSKALAVQGGYVSGSKNLINYLKQRGRTFVYSTASSPMIIGGLHKSLELCQNEDWRRLALHRNAKKIRDFCAQHFAQSQNPQNTNNLHIHYKKSVGDSQIICLTLQNNQQCLAASEFLWEEGLWLHPIRTPTVKKPCLRIVPNAMHDEADLMKLFEALLKLKSSFCGVL